MFLQESEQTPKKISIEGFFPHQATGPKPPEGLNVLQNYECYYIGMTKITIPTTKQGLDYTNCNFSFSAVSLSLADDNLIL